MQQKTLGFAELFDLERTDEDTWIGRNDGIGCPSCSADSWSASRSSLPVRSVEDKLVHSDAHHVPARRGDREPVTFTCRAPARRPDGSRRGRSAPGRETDCCAAPSRRAPSPPRACRTLDRPDTHRPRGVSDARRGGRGRRRAGRVLGGLRAPIEVRPRARSAGPVRTPRHPPTACGCDRIEKLPTTRQCIWQHWPMPATLMLMSSAVTHTVTSAAMNAACPIVGRPSRSTTPSGSAAPPAPTNGCCSSRPRPWLARPRAHRVGRLRPHRRAGGPRRARGTPARPAPDPPHQPTKDCT